MVDVPPVIVDLVDKGQCNVNLIWEITQGLIALFTTVAIIYCGIHGISNSELTNAFFLIIGFYFARANHAANGIGNKPNNNYEGH